MEQQCERLFGAPAAPLDADIVIDYISGELNDVDLANIDDNNNVRQLSGIVSSRDSLLTDLTDHAPSYSQASVALFNSEASKGSENSEFVHRPVSQFVVMSTPLVENTNIVISDYFVAE